MKNIIIAIIAFIGVSATSLAEDTMPTIEQNSIIADAVENGISSKTFLLSSEELCDLIHDFVKDSRPAKREVLRALVKLHSSDIKHEKINKIVLNRSCGTVRNFDVFIDHLPYITDKSPIDARLTPDQFIDNLTDLEVHFMYNEFWTNLKMESTLKREAREAEERAARDEMAFKENHPILYFIKHL